MPRLEERQLLRWFLPTIRDVGEEMDSTVLATQDAYENRWTNPSVELMPCAGHKLRPVETIVGTSTLPVWSCGTSGMAASPKSKYSAISDWILELSMVMAG